MLITLLSAPTISAARRWCAVADKTVISLERLEGHYFFIKKNNTVKSFGVDSPSAAGARRGWESRGGGRWSRVGGSQPGGGAWRIGGVRIIHTKKRKEGSRKGGVVKVEEGGRRWLRE